MTLLAALILIPLFFVGVFVLSLFAPREREDKNGMARAIFANSRPDDGREPVSDNAYGWPN